MENRDKKISAMVNGYQVTFGFTNEPKKDLEGKIRGILLDSFIAQNKGLVSLDSSVNPAQKS